MNAPIREQTLIITRRAFTAALSLTGLAALAGFSPLRLITDAMAQSASDVAKPVSLPDMALGPANATVTITEYASMTCPHCAAFTEKVFPKIKSEYHRHRQDPLRVPRIPARHQGRGWLDAGALHRQGRRRRNISPSSTCCSSQQNDWVMKNTTETLTRIGKQAGLTQQQVEDCLKDQALLDKIAADQKYATEVLKVQLDTDLLHQRRDAQGRAEFEEFDKRINSLLKS